MSEALTADEVIAHLGLKPHPDGGWYRETFRDERGHAGRAHSTAILYLAEGRRSGALAPRGRGAPLSARGQGGRHAP